MNNEALLDEFWEVERSPGARLALRLVSDHPTGLTSEYFNVWNVHIDADRGVVRLEHDFAPNEGTMPLTEFIEGLEARLITEEHL